MSQDANSENNKESTKKSLKIAYVIPRFHPFKGGAERNLEAMAERMVKEGHDVTVITTDVKFRSETLSKQEVYKGIKIERLHAWNKSLYAGFYPELLPYLLGNDFDVIHTSGIGFIWREVCLILRKIFKSNTKYLTTPHGPFMALGDQHGFRGLTRKTYTFFLRMFLNWLYDEVIAVTPKQIEWMKNDYNFSENKIYVIPNGIDSKYIENELIVHRSKDKVVISFTGRMEWYKGVQDVIRALHKIKTHQTTKTLNDFEFVIMGRAGNYTQNLKELVDELHMQNNVSFIFSPTDEERDAVLYIQSQIHILPSKWEATGIVLIEAMAKGNVIITTTGNEGAEMLIKNGENGFIYDFTDVDELAKILRKLLSDPKLLEQMRKINLEKSKNFTWDAVFPKYLDLVTKLKS